MPHRKQLLGPRSSLVSHVFPQFYACYLLKSIQTPQSQTVYIGSTPNPPRRMRQHNGELKQGAWKTRLRRPWEMQLIVHGFPSRLAALQFEWAWQHPHLSRHLREPDGTQSFAVQRPKRVKNSVQVLRSMITSHPYSNWPLHIKLFTTEAVKFWEKPAPGTKRLPLGFICSMELEGVDGKSGRKGSGRSGPISVKDEAFTSSYLAKSTSLLSSNRPMMCNICQEHLENYTTDTLTTALCPSPTCNAVSHLSCLSRYFLHSEPINSGLIPRGGVCISCKTHVLWGDVVRGCYRRKAGGILPEEEDMLESGPGELSEYSGRCGLSPRVMEAKEGQKSNSLISQMGKTSKRKTNEMAKRVSENEHSDSSLEDLSIDHAKGGQLMKASTPGATLTLLGNNDLRPFNLDPGLANDGASRPATMKLSRRAKAKNEDAGLLMTPKRKRGRPLKNTRAENYSTVTCAPAADSSSRLLNFDSASVSLPCDLSSQLSTLERTLTSISISSPKLHFTEISD